MSSQKHFTLILLYDKMVASLPVAQALKEKGIDVHVSQNAGELIQTIASKNIDLVGLSANHASTRSLIQVLREKTTVKILIFGEDKAHTTVERIDRLDADFKVQGVATAYNIWMKIAHVVKSKIKEADTNGNILYSGGKSTSSSDNQSIVVKNSNNLSKTNLSGATNIFSKKKKDKKQKEKLDEDSDKIEVSDFQKKSQKQSDVMYFKKESAEMSVGSGGVETQELAAKSGKKESPFKKSSLKKNKQKSEEQQIDEEVSAVEQMFKDPFQKKSRDIVSPDVESSSPLKQGGVTVDKNSQQEPPEESIRDSELDELMKEESLGSVQNLSQLASDDIGSVQFDQSKKAKFKGKKTSAKKQDVGASAFEEAPTNKIEFKQLVERAAHSAYVSNQTGIENFGAINKMTVVPVDQNQDRGFLVFCTSDNQFLTSGGTTVDVFKKSLQEKMHHQDAMGIGESYNIETEEIELLGWVPSASQFHFVVEDPKSQKQILICFIARECIYPDTNKSIELNMLKVELEVLPTLTPINFNVFLYFARNKRLIPYVRRGGRLTEDQLGRLNKHGIDTIYISESDRKALYSFFISQTIHQDLQPAKKAA